MYLKRYPVARKNYLKLSASGGIMILAWRVIAHASVS